MCRKSWVWRGLVGHLKAGDDRIGRRCEDRFYPVGSAELPSAAAYSGGEARVWRYNYLRNRFASDLSI